MENKPLSTKEKIGIGAGLTCVFAALLALALNGVSEAASNFCAAMVGLSGITLVALVSLGLAGLFKQPADEPPDEPED